MASPSVLKENALYRLMEALLGQHYADAAQPKSVGMPFSASLTITLPVIDKPISDGP
jgi:hypothetical protein